MKERIRRLLVLLGGVKGRGRKASLPKLGWFVFQRNLALLMKVLRPF